MDIFLIRMHAGGNLKGKLEFSFISLYWEKIEHEKNILSYHFHP